MGICDEIEEFMNRLPVRIPGWREPMVPVTLEEHQQMLRGVEQVKRDEHLREMTRGLSPDHLYEEMGMSTRMLLDTTGRWSSLETAGYLILRAMGDRFEAEADPNRQGQLDAIRALQAQFEHWAGSAAVGLGH